MIVKVHKKVAALAKEVAASPFPEVLVDGQCCMATDGVMMVVLEHYAPTEPTIQTTYLLTSAQVEAVKDGAVKGKADDAGFAEVNAAGLDLANHTITAMLEKATKKSKGIPKVFCFDLDRLVQLSKVLYAGEGAHKRKVVTVRVFDDEKAPIEVVAKLATAKATAYLAPCRKEAGRETA